MIRKTPGPKPTNEVMLSVPSRVRSCVTANNAAPPGLPSETSTFAALPRTSESAPRVWPCTPSNVPPPAIDTGAWIVPVPPSEPPDWTNTEPVPVPSTSLTSNVPPWTFTVPPNWLALPVRTVTPAIWLIVPTPWICGAKT